MKLNLPVHPSLRHPLTGQPLEAVGVSKRGPIWPVMGAADDPPPDPPKDPAAGPLADPPKDPPPDPPKPKEPGFPKDTPLEAMTVDQQLAYWKHQSRKHESTWKDIVGDRKVDDVKNDLTEYEQIRQEKLTPSEKALEQARNEGREEAAKELNPKFVASAFNTALAHIEKDEDRAELIDTLDLSKFIDDKGNVDTAKVASVAKRIAPADTGAGGKRYDYGAGHRAPSNASGVTAGAERYQQRHGKKSSS